jgi:hypothetical protein
MRAFFRPGSLTVGLVAGLVLGTAATAIAEDHHSVVRIVESVLLPVNVTGGQVNVSATTPLPVTLATQTVFRSFNSVGAAETTQFTNTSGQVLVIDALSATPTGSTGFVVTIHSGSTAYENYFTFANQFALYQLTKLYLQPGDSLSTRSDGFGIIYSFSGHYE